MLASVRKKPVIFWKHRIASFTVVTCSAKAPGFPDRRTAGYFTPAGHNSTRTIERVSVLRIFPVTADVHSAFV